jgi:hypothetical protein
VGVNPPRLRLEVIRFFQSREAAIAWGAPEADGYAWYEVEHDAPGEVAHMADGSTRRDVAYTYMAQPFALGASREDKNGRIMWGWDGDRTAPTLSPSFDCRAPAEPRRGIPAHRAHLFLVRGRVELCSDSTVVLA